MTFGRFEQVCNRTAFPICNVVASINNSTDFNRGIIPVCYSRSVELANTMIFQIGNAFVHFGSLIVLLIIIFHVRSRYTAIGRTEMLQFFYLCICLVISSLVVDCGVAPPTSSSYAYFVALQFGFISAVCACIFYNGLLCFQFWEDGSRKSMFILRAVLFGWFACNYIISIITFKSWGTLLNSGSTEVLFVVSYVINALLLAAYFVSQIILVIFALDLYWHLGAIFLAAFFFVAGQVLVYVFSEDICEGLSHYIDGIFFGSLCNLFTIMMIYKYWDMITTDDLEFSVATVEQGISAFDDEDEKRNYGYSYK